MPQQNFENHTRSVPLYSAAALILFATFIGACVNLWKAAGDHSRLYSAALLVVVTACLILALYFARAFALKAQDRAIRAEENLRHFVLTGRLLDARLHPLQIVALRFAADDEFPALAERAAQDNLPPKEIKRAIRNWRADGYRV